MQLIALPLLILSLLLAASGARANEPAASGLAARASPGLTALQRAALCGDLQSARQLLNAGAALNVGDRNGLTALHLAAQYGHAAMIELLLDYGADINARTYQRGLTPLHWAACWGHCEGLGALLAGGADINARDHIGDTPLTWAEEYRHHDMARLLARLGGKRHLN